MNDNYDRNHCAFNKKPRGINSDNNYDSYSLQQLLIKIDEMPQSRPFIHSCSMNGSHSESSNHKHIVYHSDNEVIWFESDDDILRSSPLFLYSSPTN